MDEQRVVRGAGLIADGDRCRVRQFVARACDKVAETVVRADDHLVFEQRVVVAIAAEWRAGRCFSERWCLACQFVVQWFLRFGFFQRYLHVVDITCHELHCDERTGSRLRRFRELIPALALQVVLLN